MRKVTFLVAAAAAFGLGPFASKLGAVASSALLILLAAALALAASASLSAISAAGGALGAFASAVVSGTSPAVAGALLVGLAYAERSGRVRGRGPRMTHVGATLLTGALAGTLSTAYSAASPTVRAVAVIVAAVLAALPLLLEAEHPVAHALDAASTRVSEPSRAALRDAAQLRRDAEEAVLDRATSREVQQTWRSLLRLAEARMRLQRSMRGIAKDGSTDAVVKMVDQRIAEHVRGLTRAYTAVDAARAAEAGVDDAALRRVEHVGESLEQVSQAIAEQT